MMRGYALGIAAGTQVFTHVGWLLFVGTPGELSTAALMGAGWVVEAVGPGVESLRVGDEVFLEAGVDGLGAFAEHVVVREGALAKKPALRSRGGRRIEALTLDDSRRAGDLEELRALLEKGRLKPVIDRVFSFADMEGAFRYVEGGHVRGKVVVDVRPAVRRQKSA